MSNHVNSTNCITFYFSYCIRCNREILLEYSKRNRELAMELLKRISMSLGLGDNYKENALNLELGMQILTGNFYPPCPGSELAIGLPPHSDHTLLTLLIQNGIYGLQVQHQSKWFNVNSTPNSFVVNVGDHMEVHPKPCLAYAYILSFLFYSISFSFVSLSGNFTRYHSNDFKFEFEIFIYFSFFKKILYVLYFTC